MLFSFIVLGFFAVIHSYLFTCLWRATGGGWWMIPIGVFFLVMLGVWFFRHTIQLSALPDWVIVCAFAWFGFAIIAAGCCAIADGLALIAMGVSKYLNLGRFTLSSGFLTVALIAAVGLSTYAVYSAYQVRITTITLETSRLRAGEKPLRLAVVTDLHLAAAIGVNDVTCVVNKIKKQNPDIFLTLGDIVDTDMTNRQQESAILNSIGAPLGSWGVPGNHEYYANIDQALEFHRQSGITMIDGTLRNVGPIWLAGLDDRANGNWTAKAEDLARRLKHLKREDPNAYIILLSHRPNTPMVLRGIADLQVSGHTHGGQIWPAGYLSQGIRDYIPQGLSTVTRDDGFSGKILVSNGTGFWGPPMRLFVPAEILIIELVAKSEAENQ